MWHVAALVPDAQRRKAKTEGGDASQVALIRCYRIAAVPDNARIRVHLFPKEPEMGALHVFKKRFVHLIEWSVARSLVRCRRFRLPPTGRQRQWRRQEVRNAQPRLNPLLQELPARQSSREPIFRIHLAQ